MRNPLSLIGLAALVCAGCVPMRLTTSPGARGMVMDANTGQPLSGAQVVVCRPNQSRREPMSVANALTHSRSPRIITKANGRFSIGDEHKWVLYFPVGVLMPASGELIITREGYHPERLPLTVESQWAGSWDRFLNGDITSLAGFTAKLKTSANPLSAFLLNQFSEAGRKAVMDYPAARTNNALLQSILVKELNAVIDGPSIYDTNRFRDVTLSADATDFIAHERGLGAMTWGMDDETYRQTYPNATTPAQVRAALNRRLLSEGYPNELSGKMGMGYYHEVGVVLLNPIQTRADRPSKQ